MHQRHNVVTNPECFVALPGEGHATQFDSPALALRALEARGATNYNGYQLAYCEDCRTGYFGVAVNVAQ